MCFYNRWEATVRAPCGECQSTWSLRTVAAPSQTKGLRLGCASLVQATVIGSLLLLFRCRNSCDYSVFLYHTNRIQYEDFFHKNALVTLSWSVFASNIGTSVHLNGSHIPPKLPRFQRQKQHSSKPVRPSGLFPTVGFS